VHPPDGRNRFSAFTYAPASRTGRTERNHGLVDLEVRSAGQQLTVPSIRDIQRAGRTVSDQSQPGTNSAGSLNRHGAERRSGYYVTTGWLTRQQSEGCSLGWRTFSGCLGAAICCATPLRYCHCLHQRGATPVNNTEQTQKSDRTASADQTVHHATVKPGFVALL
jgi:hypothetical protein